MYEHHQSAGPSAPPSPGPYAPPPPPPPPPPAAPSGWPAVDPYAPPTAPPVLAPPSGRLSADEARAARLAVPYLGPESAPSHTPGRVLIGASGGAILARLALAALNWQRAGLALRLADLRDQRAVLPRSSAVAEAASIDRALADNQQLMNTVSTFSAAAFLLGVVMFFVWRGSRRPNDVLGAHGETHVESPLRWINVGWARVAPLSLVVASVVAAATAAGLTSSPAWKVDFESWATGHRWAAVASLLWVLVWASQIRVVLLGERAHADRLAVSGAHRAGLVGAPAFLPVPHADDNIDFGEPEGAGWIFRTAGLFMAGLISGLTVVGALAERTATAALVGLPAAAVFGIVVWAFVRRHHEKATRRATTIGAGLPVAGPGAF